MMAFNSVKAAGIAMRVASGFFFIVGIILIVFGCVLTNPPRGYAPGMFVFLGSLNLFASLAGFWGSYNKKRVLLVFIVSGGLSLLLQIIFIITLHTAFDSVLNAVVKYSGKITDDERASLGHQLNVMRWVALGFLFIELLTVVLAVLLKWVLKEDVEYHGFDDDANEARSLQLGNLRSDVESGRKNEKAYDKIRAKMALKYGAVAGAVGDWKKKTKISFQGGSL